MLRRVKHLVPLLLALGATIAGCGAGAQQAPSAAGDGRLRFDTSGWRTDFSRHSVPLEEIRSGGPGRDGIPPIDEPKFVSVEEAEGFLTPREPVMVVEGSGSARAYPLQILVWHEIVNDTFAGRPIAVTYCPLCNSALVYDRRVDGRTLRFGTTGNLRRSDLVMWDDATESWWQQFSGEAIVGELTGTRLEPIPSQTLSFEDFRARYPDGEVLSRDTGFDRDYGSNPYVGYEDPNNLDEQPFLLDEDADDRLPAKERVLAITHGGGGATVVPFSRLETEPVVNAQAAGRPVVVLYEPGVVSALDAAAISRSEDVGTAATFDRRLDGRTLAFAPAGDGRFRDRQTGSTWDITGRAVAGELQGKRLKPVVSASIHRFCRSTRVWGPEARWVRRCGRWRGFGCAGWSGGRPVVASGLWCVGFLG